jgi:hypothetical protein
MNTTRKSDASSGGMDAVAAVPQRSPDDISTCKRIADSLVESGLWRIPGLTQEQRRIWRISPEPFPLSAEYVSFLERLGSALHSFYTAANSLYLRQSYPWFNDYLDRGKPQSLIEYGHMRFQRRRLPAIIRPDIIMGEDGDYITELDSVPGGFGLTDGLSKVYQDIGFTLVGGDRGILHGLADSLRSVTEGKEKELSVAIVVSEESEDYRSEMEWIASELQSLGWTAFALRPEEITFTEEGLFARESDRLVRLDVIYRFFELFDLKNIPKSELVMYAAKKKRVAVTPPYKAHLEEKSLLALFHNPLLENTWRKEMGDAHFDLLHKCIPQTWALDNRPCPPHAIIPDLQFRGSSINDWRALKEGSQKERRFVIKPSGFSALAWGSRGVVVGHDVSQEDWADALERALSGFEALPYVLQPFHEGKRVTVRYYDERDNVVCEMAGRVRLSPYYFVSEDNAKLGGVLATVCPPDKKLIHGLVDAVMAPCAIAGKQVQEAR